MLNKEKFAEKILDIACNGSRLAVNKATLELTACREIGCRDCLFNTHSHVDCEDETYKWANSEYVEPPVDWSKVAVDTPILVRDCDCQDWFKRYFAKFENGVVFSWANGSTSWSADEYTKTWAQAKLAESEE